MLTFLNRGGSLCHPRWWRKPTSKKFVRFTGLLVFATLSLSIHWSECCWCCLIQWREKWCTGWTNQNPIRILVSAETGIHDVRVSVCPCFYVCVVITSLNNSAHSSNRNIKKNILISRHFLKLLPCHCTRVDIMELDIFLCFTKLKQSIIF